MSPTGSKIEERYKQPMIPALGIVILAAGLGTRMKSEKAKVLHSILGRPMIAYVVETAAAIAGQNVVVVVGYQAEQVKHAVSRTREALFAFQEQQLGTGHAVLCAMPSLPGHVEQVVILCGDVPLIQAATIEHIVSEHIANHHDLTLLGVSREDPTGYGRLVFNDVGDLAAIVEEADADAAQKKIKTINTGIYVIRRDFLELALPRLGSNNKQNEIYLTDIIGLGYQEKRSLGVVIGHDSNEIIGVNSPAELQIVEQLMEWRIREKS
jgi:UDP-N-acetylglucosamine diphosphorylase/glucosamine-1-phosphate N-acetyltransferase